MTINRRNVVLGGAVAAGAALLYFYDPASASFYPSCPLRTLTGLLCPLCGGLRSAHALLHGHVFDAVALNPFVVAAGLAWPVVPLRWIGIGAAIFTVTRNIV
jgi:hypothetical protein